MLLEDGLSTGRQDRIRLSLRSGKIHAMLTTAKWTIEDYHRMIDSGILEGS